MIDLITTITIAAIALIGGIGLGFIAGIAVDTFIGEDSNE